VVVQALITFPIPTWLLLATNAEVIALAFFADGPLSGFAGSPDSVVCGNCEALKLAGLPVEMFQHVLEPEEALIFAFRFDHVRRKHNGPVRASAVLF
jgi:hypothetical protein